MGSGQRSPDVVIVRLGPYRIGHIRRRRRRTGIVKGTEQFVYCLGQKSKWLKETSQKLAYIVYFHWAHPPIIGKLPPVLPSELIHPFQNVHSLCSSFLEGQQTQDVKTIPSAWQLTAEVSVKSRLWWNELGLCQSWSCAPHNHSVLPLICSKALAPVTSCRKPWNVCWVRWDNPHW